ncbi:uncharacterized protein IL334_004856 [Kwoniella shivajii]|uniref:Uncharacterized protein n=1 Tax=Kwoniella shivajii TaxID=564305 RepID=A0ABZ1D1J0_9TREE|nr:hypothetical protein IL334_004856 [Kwoniella shivajii]
MQHLVSNMHGPSRKRDTTLSADFNLFDLTKGEWVKGPNNFDADMPADYSMSGEDWWMAGFEVAALKLDDNECITDKSFGRNALQQMGLECSQERKHIAIR